MRDLLQRVNAGIGATRTVHVDALTRDEADGGCQRALDAPARLLNLPAYEVGTVVLESQCDSRHTA